MKTFITCLLFVIAFSKVKAQETETFLPGYFIIEKSAKYITVSPSGADVLSNPTEIESVMAGIKMIAGEVIFIANKLGNDYLAYDPLGRVMLFRGGVTRAPITKITGVGRLSGDINMVNGDVLHEGSYLWITGQNTAKATVTVLMHSNQSIEIPSTSIEFLNTSLKQRSRTGAYIEVE